MKTYNWIYATILAAIFFTSCKGKAKKSELNSEKMASQLDSLIYAEEKQGFHGVVHIEKDGKTLLSKGYGYANEETKLKFTTSTFVQIGSGVKDFTKVAIYQLVENGKLKLDDPLSKFIPGLTGNKQQITVQHLLVHKAGFPIGEKTDGDPFTTAELVETVQNKPLKAQPGQKENYSNLGYSCLAYIIEQVSGKAFDRYVFDQIIKPIGLVNTGTYIPKFDRANIAHGYGRDGKDIGIILDMPHDDNGHLWSLRGNGGYLSTNEEISKFFKALENNTLLKTEAFRKAVFNPANHMMLAGSDMVSFFIFSNMPGHKARVIIATNHGNYEGPRLLRKIEVYLSNGGKGQGNTMKAERHIDLGDGNEGEKQVFKGPLLEKLPETEAGLTIKKYLDAFNSGDPETMRKFFENFAKKSENALPIVKRLENFKNLYADMGKLKFQNLNASQSSEGIWEVSVITYKSEPAKFIFRIETKSPWKFEGLQIGVGI